MVPVQNKIFMNVWSQVQRNVSGLVRVDGLGGAFIPVWDGIRNQVKELVLSHVENQVKDEIE